MASVATRRTRRIRYDVTLHTVTYVPAADRMMCAPMPFEAVDGHGTKVLSLECHPEGDYFCCALSFDASPVCTKRGILSLVARIFDPLGVFGQIYHAADMTARSEVG